mgnify:CR=1 FL=1
MRKVIGIGETVLDILFRDGQPIGALPGGSVFNALVSLGRCGVPSTMIGETGDDRLGEMTIRFLKDNGVCADYIQTYAGARSALSLAFLNEHNDAEYLFYKDHPHYRLDFGLRGDKMPDIEADDILLFGSFYAVNPVIREQMKSLLDKAHEAGAIIYYDVNYRPSHKGDIMRITPHLMENFEYADIVRGSTDDFMTLYEKDDAEQIFRANISFYCRNLIVTSGPKPVKVLTKEGLRQEVPTDTREKAVSTVGAGDSFNAGFIFSLLQQGITHEMIQQGLESGQWEKLIQTGQRFAAESCRDIYNYVSKEFGQKEKVSEKSQKSLFDELEEIQET